MKMKNDHRSKFSNISTWKEEAWKNQNFNGIQTRDFHDTGAMLHQLSYEALASSFQLLNLKFTAMNILHFHAVKK